MQFLNMNTRYAVGESLRSVEEKTIKYIEKKLNAKYVCIVHLDCVPNMPSNMPYFVQNNYYRFISCLDGSFIDAYACYYTRTANGKTFYVWVTSELKPLY